MAAPMPKQGGSAKSFSLYDFDTDLRARVAQLAAAERRTLSAQIQVLLTEALAARSKNQE
jgi:hypothetical protein